MELQTLKENIGKRCKVTNSAISGLSGKEALITGISGDKRVGFRYDIILDEPLYSFTEKLDFYPPVFLVEII